MNRTWQSLLAIGLIALVALPLMAQEEKKKKRQRGQGVVTQLQKQFAKANLSEEQVKKLQAVAKEYGPKLNDARKKVALTDEQKKARVEATKKATEEGLKGKKRAEAIAAAVNMSEAQKAATAEMAKIQASMREAVMGMLTDDQKKAMAKKGGKRKNKKKKDDK